MGLGAAHANVSNVKSGSVLFSNGLAINGDVMEGIKGVGKDRLLRDLGDLQSLRDGLYRILKDVFRFDTFHIVERAPIPIFLGIQHVRSGRMFLQLVVVSRGIIRGTSVFV